MMSTRKGVSAYSSLLDCMQCGSLCLGPTILPCGHCLCRRCVRRMLQVHNEENPATCPSCHHPLTASKDRDFAEHAVLQCLAKDIVIEEMVADNLSSHAGTTPCHVCHGKYSSQVCIDCGDFFCEPCSSTHLKTEGHTEHILQTLQKDSSNTAHLPAKKNFNQLRALFEKIGSGGGNKPANEDLLRKEALLMYDLRSQLREAERRVDVCMVRLQEFKSELQRKHKILGLYAFQLKKPNVDLINSASSFLPRARRVRQECQPPEMSDGSRPMCLLCNVRQVKKDGQTSTELAFVEATEQMDVEQTTEKNSRKQEVYPSAPDAEVREESLQPPVQSDKTLTSASEVPILDDKTETVCAGNVTNFAQSKSPEEILSLQEPDEIPTDEAVTDTSETSAFSAQTDIYCAGNVTYSIESKPFEETMLLQEPNLIQSDETVPDTSEIPALVSQAQTGSARKDIDFTESKSLEETLTQESDQIQADDTIVQDASELLSLDDKTDTIVQDASELLSLDDKTDTIVQDASELLSLDDKTDTIVQDASELLSLDDKTDTIVQDASELLSLDDKTDTIVQDASELLSLDDKTDTIVQDASELLSLDDKADTISNTLDFIVSKPEETLSLQEEPDRIHSVGAVTDTLELLPFNIETESICTGSITDFLVPKPEETLSLQQESDQIKADESDSEESDLLTFSTENICAGNINDFTVSKPEETPLLLQESDQMQDDEAVTGVSAFNAQSATDDVGNRVEFTVSASEDILTQELDQIISDEAAMIASQTTHSCNNTEAAVRSMTEDALGQADPAPPVDSDLFELQRTTINIDTASIHLEVITDSRVLESAENILLAKAQWSSNNFLEKLEGCKKQTVSQNELKQEDEETNLLLEETPEKCQPMKDQTEFFTFVMSLEMISEELLPTVLEKLSICLPEVIQQLFQDFRIHLLGVDKDFNFLMEGPELLLDNDEELQLVKLALENLLLDRTEIRWSDLVLCIGTKDLELRIGQPSPVQRMIDA